jgi:hypothetical protein
MDWRLIDSSNRKELVSEEQLFDEDDLMRFCVYEKAEHPNTEYGLREISNGTSGQVETAEKAPYLLRQGEYLLRQCDIQSESLLIDLFGAVD